MPEALQLKMLNNYVLIHPDYDRYEKDGELAINTTYEKQKHAPTSGKVVAVPSHLNYVSNEYDKDSLLYDTDMELQVGDTVIFGYNAIQMALSSQKMMGDMILLRYDSLYCAVRPPEITSSALPPQIIMLNGYIIVEAITDKVQQNMIASPLEDINTYQKGIIRNIGTGNRAYRLYEEISGDPDGLEAGQTVLFHLQHSIPLQYQMHSIIDSGKELYRMQQKDVTAVIQEVMV